MHIIRLLNDGDEVDGNVSVEKPRWRLMRQNIQGGTPSPPTDYRDGDGTVLFYSSFRYKKRKPKNNYREHGREGGMNVAGAWHPSDSLLSRLKAQGHTAFSSPAWSREWRYPNGGMIKQAMRDAGLEVLEGHAEARAREEHTRQLEMTLEIAAHAGMKQHLSEQDKSAWNVEVEMWGQDPNTDGRASRDLGITYWSAGSTSSSPFSPWEKEVEVEKKLAKDRKQKKRGNSARGNSAAHSGANNKKVRHNNK